MQYSAAAGDGAFVAAIHDITERKRIEEKFKASEARYAAAIELMPDGHLITDDRGSIQAFNAAAEVIFGYDSEEMIGKNIGMLMTEPDRAAHHHFLSPFHAPENSTVIGRRRDGGLIAVRKGGTTFPISLLVQKFETDEGVFFSGIISDISDLNQIEARNRQLTAVVEQATDTIMVLNADRGIEYLNPAAERELGWSLDEVRGKTSADLNIRRSSSLTYDAMNQALENDGIWKGNLRSVSRDGRDIETDITASAMKDDLGRITHYLMIGRDVTERVKMEQELARAQKLESIGQLAAGIAHEINTPSQYVGDNTRFLKESFDNLNSMLGKLGALLEGDGTTILKEDVKLLLDAADAEYLQDEIPRAIDQSLDGIARVSKIVRAMKEFSHPADEKVPLNLNRAIESTITVASNEWKYVAEMRTDFDPLLLTVQCLPGEFNQVILGIIVNAAHAISEVCDADDGKLGTITVSTKLLDDWAEIRISDTGGGIPDEIRSRIFDPFFTTKEVGKGTGQGLSIAHSIVVEKHGGTLNVESEIGEGSCFVIRLPLDDENLMNATVAA